MQLLHVTNARASLLSPYSATLLLPFYDVRSGRLHDNGLNLKKDIKNNKDNLVEECKVLLLLLSVPIILSQVDSTSSCSRCSAANEENVIQSVMIGQPWKDITLISTISTPEARARLEELHSNYYPSLEMETAPFEEHHFPLLSLTLIKHAIQLHRLATRTQPSSRSYTSRM